MKSQQRKENAVHNFRRTIHQGKSPRQGLAMARARFDPLTFPLVVSTLGRQPIYRGLFALTTFPLRLEHLTAKVRLGPVADRAELIWTACVLSLFQDKLNSYVTLRDEFYRSFFEGKLNQAELALNTIEGQFGVSLWLIQYRLQLLQALQGLEAQKDYVERILATEGINSLSAWLSYFFSLRSEENVSFTKLYDELADVIPVRGLGDYVLTHVLPFDLTQIQNVAAPVNFEEANPLIDRFETFVSMAQVHLSRFPNAQDQYLATALAQVRSIADERIRRMYSVLIDSDTHDAVPSVILAADSYTRGEYDAVEECDADCLELIARARALGAKNRGSNKNSFREKIIDAIQGIVSLSPHAQQYRQDLKKLALSCPRHSYAIQILGFLQRNHDVISVKEWSDVEYLCALNFPLEDPRNSLIIATFPARERWLQKLLGDYAESAALQLVQAYQRKSQLDEMRDVLPNYRYDVYRGHVEFARGEIENSIALYQKVVDHSNQFISWRAKRYLYKAYYASERLRECLSLVVEHTLQNPAAVLAYEIDDLARRCLDAGEFASEINFAILLHLNVVHVHHSWQRELSDVFENVLLAAGISTPSEVSEHADLFPAAQTLYFLKHISTQRVLDDTTCFSSVEEIEQERIAICQFLLTIDAANKDEYLSEIRSITRDSNVAHLLKKVQSSKIYVDEAGLRQALENSLMDTYLRYQRLLDSPALAYQAEKISRRLEEMLAAKGNNDLRELKLPASEREALFETMLSDFLAEFAFSPAYGLDTHISTSIRHGAFEGHIRAPLASEDLLCKKRGKEYFLSTTWEQKLADLSPEGLLYVQRQLGRFTARIEELITIYLREKIRVRDESNGSGMFIFDANVVATRALRESINKSTEYHAFLDKFFSHAWQLVDESMKLIRDDLRDFLLHQVNQACDALVASVEHSLGHDKVGPLVDAVVRAQTQFQSAVTDVAEWFRRPQDMSRDPFDFEVAVHVALQQIANCYVDTPVQPELDLHVAATVDGSLLDGMCEIFFILIQNAILHSGLRGQQLRVKISASRQADQLIISCSNNLTDEIDLAARRVVAQEAIANYKRDTALRLARVEGGSGLSKIWRICEFDLQLGHTLDIRVDDDCSFTTTVTLSGLQVKKKC